jgi:hypothetical protein
MSPVLALDLPHDGVICTERESLLGAVPLDNLVSRTSVYTLRVWELKLFWTARFYLIEVW